MMAMYIVAYSTFAIEYEEQKNESPKRLTTISQQHRQINMVVPDLKWLQNQCTHQGKQPSR